MPFAAEAVDPPAPQGLSLLVPMPAPPAGDRIALAGHRSTRCMCRNFPLRKRSMCSVRSPREAGWPAFGSREQCGCTPCRSIRFLQCVFASLLNRSKGLTLRNCSFEGASTERASHVPGIVRGYAGHGIYAHFFANTGCQFLQQSSGRSLPFNE